MTARPTVVIAGTASVVMVAFLLATFAYKRSARPDDVFQTSPPTSPHQATVRENVVDFIINNVDPSNIRDNLKYLTGKVHVGGTAAEGVTAQWVHDTWRDQGLDHVTIRSYDVLLSYPTADTPNMVRLVSCGGAGDGGDGWDVVWESTPRQPPLYAPEEGDEDVLFNYNAFSAPGDVKAGLVYVNYGRLEDFKELEALGVSVAARVVIARYGKIFRANIAKTAEDEGAVGVIFFSDPGDYAPPEGASVYPHSVLLPPAGAQLGTVKLFNGDSLTPFYPAIESAFRIPEEEAELPRIPVQPIGYDDAWHLFNALGGSEAPKSWQGGLNLTYHLGPGLHGSPPLLVHLEVHTHTVPGTVHNVVGVIVGSEEPDRYVVLGNHRDAWFFGSVDPSSGGAAMMELSRVLMSLHNSTGWRPRRSLVLCSWAAEEFGLLGSVEWTEQFAKQLGDRAVAYLNIDQAINGNYSFRAKSTPLLYSLLWEVTKQVPNPDPEEIAAGRLTVYDTWLERLADLDHLDRPWLNPIASGSDFVTFQQVVGVPCLDLRYTGDRSTIGEPLYHTLYETFALVDELYDRGFHFHAAVTSVWALLAVSLADAKVIPFSPGYYAEFITQAQQQLQADYGELLTSRNISLAYFLNAGEKFAGDVAEFLAGLETIDLTNPLTVRRINDQLMLLERAFLDPRGLPHRPHYLHVVTSPSELNSYSGSPFPGLNDALTKLAATKYTPNPNTPKTNADTRRTNLKTPSTNLKTPSTNPDTPGTDPDTPSTNPKTPSTNPKTPSTNPRTPSTNPKTPSTNPKTPDTPDFVSEAQWREFEEHLAAVTHLLTTAGAVLSDRLW